MVGCRQRGAVITVVDPDAARRSLVAGELACPQPDCGGRLRVWSRALPRRVRGLDGTVVRATPDRARCRACRVSPVLLPAGWLPRRGYDVDVVGAALLAAAGCGGPRVRTGPGHPTPTRPGRTALGDRLSRDPGRTPPPAHPPPAAGGRPHRGPCGPARLAADHRPEPGPVPHLRPGRLIHNRRSRPRHARIRRHDAHNRPVTRRTNTPPVAATRCPPQRHHAHDRAPRAPHHDAIRLTQPVAILLIQRVRQQPGLEAVAPTLAYDFEIMGDVNKGGTIPTDLIGRVTATELVLCGASPAWMIDVG